MTMHAATRPKLGYDDYARIPDDGQRHEIVDGEHFVNPAPNLPHQRILGNLYYEFTTRFARVGLGDVLLASVDVQLSEHDIVQPDLVVVLAEHKSILIPSRVLGTPDLLVEILSPSTATYDRSHKKSTYERMGVPEFWIVDPARRTVEQFVLVDGTYQLQPAAEAIRLSIVKDVSIPLAEVW
jgi:Uma2 family endonuclease